LKDLLTFLIFLMEMTELIDIEAKMESLDLDAENAKKKKGRPRKPLVAIEEEVVVEKKKRGRKKKVVEEEVVKQKKKRGRKAAVKYFSSSIRKKMPLTTVMQDNNNYILHIDIVENKEEVKEIVSNDDELKKDIEALFENDQSILYDYMDQGEECDLRDLYEHRIKKREHQDKLLIDKMERMHNDDALLDKFLGSENRNNAANADCHVEEESRQESNRKKDHSGTGYFELLYKFVHNEKWIDHTDVCCWWCCHQFSTVPIGLPVDFIQRKGKFRVKGVYCSFGCMIAYKNDNNIKQKEYLIKLLYTKITGESGDTVLKPAPPRCCLKMFGGELDIEDFRKSSLEHKVFKMIEYPMFVSRDYVEEVDIQNVKNANMKLFSSAPLQANNLDSKRVEDAKQRLAQIERTTVTLGNTIDKFII
jgi:hypothetical protein